MALPVTGEFAVRQEFVPPDGVPFDSGTPPPCTPPMTHSLRLKHPPATQPLMSKPTQQPRDQGNVNACTRNGLVRPTYQVETTSGRRGTRTPDIFLVREAL